MIVIRALAVSILVLLAPCPPAWAMPPTQESSRPRQIRDPRIAQALAWLPTPPDVPILVVDVDRLPARLARGVRTACAYVIRGIRRIHVSSRCRVYQRAEHNPLDAIGLAAVLGHEMAHLEGADEARARDVERQLFRDLSATLPGEYRVRVAVYLAALAQRPSPRISVAVQDRADGSGRASPVDTRVTRCSTHGHIGPLASPLPLSALADSQGGCP